MQATPLGTPKISTPGAGGSGPGYGSGALGLSLGVNNHYASPGSVPAGAQGAAARTLTPSGLWGRRGDDQHEEAVEEGISMIGLN